MSRGLSGAATVIKTDKHFKLSACLWFYGHLTRAPCFSPPRSSFFSVWDLPKCTLGNAWTWPPFSSTGRRRCPGRMQRAEETPLCRPGRLSSPRALGVGAGSPLLGLSPSAGTTARPPSRRGCSLISGMKTGMPTRGSWSCLFLPHSKILIRKRIRLKAPPGSAIPRTGECEKAGIPGTGAGLSERRLSLAPD